MTDLLSVESFALFILLIRILYYQLCSDGSILSHPSILYYLVAIFLNIPLNLILTDKQEINEIYHSTMPWVILIPFLLKNRRIEVDIFTIMLLSIINFIISSYYIKLFLYISSIIIMLFTAIKIVIKSKTHLNKSPLYVVIAVDLLITIVIMILSEFEVDWSLSNYIDILGSLNSSVFFCNVVLYHVFIRRYFFD